MNKILNFENISLFPKEGEEGVVYADQRSRTFYVWDGSQYQLAEPPKETYFVGPHPQKPPSK